MKIIFLDIDGPMIPSSMFLVDRMASFHRLFPPTTVAVVNELCKRTRAKIVLNTTHNNPAPPVPDIEVALVNHGLDSAHLHPDDPKTRYPSLRRDAAIEDWLSRHPEVGRNDWVAIDDTRCADKRHMILIDSDNGLTVRDLNRVIDMLGGDRVKVLI